MEIELFRYLQNPIRKQPGADKKNQLNTTYFYEFVKSEIRNKSQIQRLKIQIRVRP